MGAASDDDLVLVLENACDAKAIVYASKEYGYGVGRQKLCELQPGEHWKAPGFGLQLTGVEVLTPEAITVGSLRINWETATAGFPTGNDLLVMRRYLQDGTQRTVVETVIGDQDLVPNANGIRFLNRGQNAVNVGGALLTPGQQLDIPAEPGYLLSSKLRIQFIGQQDLVEQLEIGP
ncbi:hypothetical protein HER32_00285 [Hymenobacter sp. BT18]|uniref:hypothetical protein n=1 Tax=Hymenobacter sp. BT18 TaxID=2835648 RepID=UPI00143E8883|nr:hypothetical protein [Hymenobacter sp. BT18]QIX59713.1 hypothetical protein HER32_00285 [Hymenobacter sp. BT18]